MVIGVIGAASYLVDFAAAALGAKKLGASPRAMIGAGLGTLSGCFSDCPGIIIGPFVGAVIGELTVNRDIRKAGKAGARRVDWIRHRHGGQSRPGVPDDRHLPVCFARVLMDRHSED